MEGNVDKNKKKTPQRKGTTSFPEPKNGRYRNKTRNRTAIPRKKKARMHYKNTISGTV